MTNRKFFIETQGCQMNEYDSSRMGDLLQATYGLEKTTNPEEADVILLNTCSIREKAQEKVFHQLGRWKHLKKQNPNLIIGVGGCVASQEGKAIRKRAPYVDVVFGPQTLHRLPEMINTVWRDKKSVVDVSFPEIEKFDALPKPSVNGATAFVSIMEGCSKYCTFCVVPYTRGEEVSRPLQDVLDEICHLADQGVREITLLGQNVNGYLGKGLMTGEVDFAELLYKVNEVPGIDRIRYTTSHPLAFSDALIQAYCDLPNLVSHVHLPVQSGSDRVLNRMKRNHTALEYKSIIRKLMVARPDISISSDFIVGFPGETEEDFMDTMKLVEFVRFDYSYSFIYSPRPGTPAASFPDDTPTEVKKQRLRILQDRITQLGFERSRAMIGKIERILVDSVSQKDPNQLHGRTENNRAMNFSSDNYELIGEFASVEVIDAYVNSLQGRLIE